MVQRAGGGAREISDRRDGARHRGDRRGARLLRRRRRGPARGAASRAPATSAMAGCSVAGDARSCRHLREAPQPVHRLASTASPPGGGANLALACDLRIAADTRADRPGVHEIGLHPGLGRRPTSCPASSARPRRSSCSTRAEMVAGRPSACALGLVNRVVPADAAGRRDRELGARDRRRAPRSPSAAPSARSYRASVAHAGARC